jgi:fructose/tagatose bisphosphate aldolase
MRLLLAGLRITRRFSAHQASVPIAVHLDHATDPEHIELALNLADQGIKFDSIMVDASHAEVCISRNLGVVCEI